MNRHAAFFGAALGGWPFGFLPSGAVQYVPLLEMDLESPARPLQDEDENLPALRVGSEFPVLNARPFVS